MTRVADYIAGFICRQGVRNVFLLSGGGSIFLDDGVACHPGLKDISCRNEAAAPLMAEACARVSGGIGVVYVTTGPGGSNAVAGLAEAWVDSAPIVVISGQVPRRHMTHRLKKKPRTFGTQELDIIPVVKPITKYAVSIRDPRQIRYHLEKAVYLARSGRPGPVWLDVPLDVQSARVDEKTLPGFIPPSRSLNRKTLERQVERIIRLLSAARRPLIIAGQGVRIAGVTAEFRELVERLGVPVVFSRLGQDIVPYSHANNFGHGGTKGTHAAGHIMKRSDLVLCLGSRLSVPFVGEDFDAFDKDARVVMVDIDSAELKKPGVKLTLAIRQDVGDVVRELKRRVSKRNAPGQRGWLAACAAYKKEFPLITSSCERNPIDLYYFVSRLDALSGSRHIFVSDAGSAYYVTGQVLRFEKGQREITSGAFASMGAAIPLAIGAAAARGDAQILAITGDGSLELNIQELKTMSFYRMNIKLFVINNGGYVSIRNSQDKLCGGRYINSDQKSSNDVLDFRKVADAFGLPYRRIERCEEVDGGIRKTLVSDGPEFIEVVCDNRQKIIEPGKFTPGTIHEEHH